MLGGNVNSQRRFWKIHVPKYGTSNQTFASNADATEVARRVAIKLNTTVYIVVAEKAVAPSPSPTVHWGLQ